MLLQEVCDELGLSAWLQPAYDKKRLLEALHTLAGRLQAMAASPPAVLQQRGTLSVQQQGVEQQSHQRLHGLQQHGLQQHGLQQQAQLLDVPMGQLGLQQAGSFPEPQMYLQPLAGPARDLLAGATAATEVQAGPSGSGPYRQQDPLLLPQLHVMPPLPQQQPLLYDEPLLQEEFQVEEGIILDFSAGQDSNM